MLFLDELPEFNRRTLEVLRQPLEDGTVTISRALIAARRFPPNFMLVAALNPCPCGYRNDPRRECHCTVPQIERYMAKISGPLLDRIDIHIEVPGRAVQGAVRRARRHDQRARCASRSSPPATMQTARFAGSRTRLQRPDVAAGRSASYCKLDDACQEPAPQPA